MALVLALRKGQDFYVGDTQVVIEAIDGRTGFTAQMEGKRFTVGLEWKLLFKGVRLSTSTPGTRKSSRGRAAGVMIDAPGMRILRGEAYRRKDNPCLVCKDVKVLYHQILCPNCSGHGCPKCVGGLKKESFVCPECNQGD